MEGKKSLLIIGYGGHGRVVEEVALATGNYYNISFLDDAREEALGKCKDYKNFIKEFDEVFIALGNNELRKNWSKKLGSEKISIPILVHPSAYVSPSAEIKEGTIVCPGAVINTNVKIGKDCIISIGALIDHDSIIEDYCHVNSGVIVSANSRVASLKKLNATTFNSKDKVKVGF